MDNDIDRPLPPFALERQYVTAKASLMVMDRLNAGLGIVLSMHTNRSGDTISHSTTFDLGFEDWTEIEALAEHLDRIVEHRKARVAALPVYIARYIDEPAFPEQRLGIDCEYQSALVETIGTMSELVEDWEFTGMTNDRDSDGRPKYFVRRKI